jgi:drug/metabolite transporter (DMT)-like permease
MAAMTHDSPARQALSPSTAPRHGTGVGLALAVGSALGFALSGPLARGLLDSGWNPASVVTVRMTVAALVLLPFGVRALHGDWSILRRSWRVVGLYGVLAVAGAQFCYFSAVDHMAVGPALLIEYTAPAAVVLWLWVMRGQRPGLMTLAGAAVAAAGLVLVLDLLSGDAHVSLVGALWSLGAMVGAAAYFIISADTDNGLPPITLAAAGLLVGAGILGALVGTGVLPAAAGRGTAAYAGQNVPWWVPLIALGLVTAAMAYVLGIAATRILGSRLASFVALTEVVAAVVFAWLLLDELPRPIQLVGGALVLLGVVGVKLGEPGVDVGPELELDVA